ncbi:unnamed protein product [Pylaiella littoralis]
MPQVAKLGVDNQMILGEVPDCLKNLTMVEQQMIVRAHLVVKMFHKPCGQRYSSGHVVSINLATDLPWRPLTEEIPILVIQPGNGGTWAGREFMASVERVQAALAYLVAHSPAYAGVRIDISRLAELRRRQDAAAANKVDVMDMFDVIDEQEDINGDGEDGLRGRPRGEPRESFIAAGATGGLSEEQGVRRASESLNTGRGRFESGNYSASLGLLREDNTHYLASMCFPKLFPNGARDPFLRARTREVGTVDALTHLMKYADMLGEGVHEAPRYRFASHRTFAYWYLNIRMRGQGKDQTRVFVNRNAEAVQRPVEEVTEAHIRELLGSATRYTAHISGTDGYWMEASSKLEEAVNQLKSPTVFSTYSAADHHWHDLHRLMPRVGPEPLTGDENSERSIHERHRSLIDNPHIADW